MKHETNEDKKRVILYLGAFLILGLLSFAHVKTVDLIDSHQENYERFEKNLERTAYQNRETGRINLLKEQELHRRKVVAVIDYYDGLMREQRQRHKAEINELLKAKETTNE